ncbi:helix-turn-helix domain-containing protein [Bosea sp. NBC_00550]|uniref:helix-turn-helix domain-containing protein n=1 Tax=Bosea sp. NBC_00550 TaxID=2969621 RepID=UPI002230CB8A|nr:helix-turn-helix transcriptional regulator [Bosea sp. NBC_00550]UZF93186.1 helix-turn-helix domain-containing protein [Bosea sp. NBC_00550]
MTTPYSPGAIGARLRIAREIIKAAGTLADMAELFGEPLQTWSRWEIGHTRLTIEIAWKIHENYPIERDWLLFGETRFLNAAQRQAIADAEARLAVTQPRGRARVS